MKASGRDSVLSREAIVFQSGELMRKTVFPMLSLFALAILAIQFLNPDPEPTPEKEKARASVMEGRRTEQASLEEQLAESILLGDDGTNLDEAYGNALLKTAPSSFLQLKRRPSAKLKDKTVIAEENRAYLPKAEPQDDLAWADKLEREGFLDEAFYHYWMLEQNWPGEKAGRDEVSKKRKACQTRISFFPKRGLTAKEKADKKRIVFFIRSGKQGLVEIDPQLFGIPKSQESAVLAAYTALQSKDLSLARYRFLALKAQLDPRSPAFYEVSWQATRLALLRGTFKREVLDVAAAEALQLRPELLCLRLDKSITTAKTKRDLAEEYGESFATLRDEEELRFWSGPAFTVHALNTVSEKAPHRGLPKRTKYNYRESLAARRAKVLDLISAAVGPLSLENASLWRLLAFQRIRLGQFREAGSVFGELVKLTKNSGDEFRRMACQLRAALKQNEGDSSPRAWQEWNESFNQFEARDGVRFSEQIQYLRGQLALRAGQLESARGLFGKLLSSKNRGIKRGAAFYCAKLDRQLIRLTLAAPFTENGQVTLQLSTRNISRLRFRFLKIEDSLTLKRGRLDEVQKQWGGFFKEQLKKSLPCVKELPWGLSAPKYGALNQSTVSLKLPGRGAWVLEAKTEFVKARVLAFYQPLNAMAIQFPESSMIVLRDDEGKALQNWTVFSARGEKMGVTDSQGALLSPLQLDYSSSRYNYSNGGCGVGSGKSGPPVASLFCVKPGQFLKAQLELGKKVQVNDIRRAPSRVYVYTDRPLYRAGETVHFKGLVRRDSLPKTRRAQGRYQVAVAEEVTVFIKQKGSLIYKAQLKSNEFGSFKGSYQFSPNAARKKYTLEIHYKGEVAKRELELRDLNKPSYSITFTPIKTGFRIFAGHPWGKPVVGAVVECFIGKKLTPVTLDENGEAILALNPGDRVSIGLKKDKEVLLQKSRQFYPPKRLLEAVRRKAAKKKTKAKPSTGSARRGRAKASEKEVVKEEKCPFDLVVERGFDPKTRTIVLSLRSDSQKPWTAWLGLGDTAAFDFRRVKGKSKDVRLVIPVTRACDPCVYAHVLFQRGKRVWQRQVRVPVRAALLTVELKTDKKVYEPGETVQFDLWTKDLAGIGAMAEASLAVVDEMIFSLKDDETPDIYDFFYEDRGTDCHFEELELLPYEAQDVLAEQSLSGAQYFAVNIEQLNYAHYSSVVDAYGIGGGAAGGYGRRIGRGMAMFACSSASAESSVTASLDWLSRHQSANGLWSNEAFNDRCKSGERCSLLGSKDFDVFSSSLATLTYLNMGHTHRFGRYKRTVKRALEKLRQLQQSDGSIGVSDEPYSILNHAAATLALCEAYAVSRDFKLKKSMKKAVDFLLSQKLKGSGWGAGKDSERANMLVTAWATYALKTAKVSRVEFSSQVFDDVLAFVDSVTDSRGWSWFEKIGEECPNALKKTNPQLDYPEWTALALVIRLFSGQSVRNAALLRSVDQLIQHCPKASMDESEVNFHYFYFSTLASFRLGGEPWDEWQRATSGLRELQEVSELCSDGSWSQSGPWTPRYGRVGNTALASLSLGIYHRYLRGGKARNFQRPVTRLHFPDTVYWNPQLKTDAKGHFRGQFKLPDTITAFRWTSRAVTKETDVGQVIRWIQVRKDFFIRLKCPKIIYQDDLCQLRADVFDYQGQRREVELELSGEGFRAQSSLLTSVQSLGNGQPKSAFWTVKALSPRTLKVIVRARCGELSDAMQLTIPVRVFGQARRSYEKRVFVDDKEFEFMLSKKAAPGSQSLRILVRPESSLFYEIFETLDFLVQFPYGCVEQTMSRFLPAVEVGDSFKQMGLPIKNFVKRFDEVTEKGVKRLSQFQKKNGSWGWFASDAPNPFMTAYVVYGLSRARKAGIQLDSSMIDRGCVYLNSVVEKQTNNDLKAFIYFALQSAGQDKLADAKKLLSVPLSSYAKALLTLTLIRSGDRASAETLLARLEKDRIDSGALSHFSTPTWFYKWEDVSIETSAFVLLAFLEVKPDHELIPRIKNWLLSKRQGKRWKTTKDSAAAVFALIKDVAISSKGRKKSAGNLFQRRFTVTLNDKETRSVVIDLSSPFESQFACLFDSSTFRRGKNKLKIAGEFSKALGPIVCESRISYTEAQRRMKAKDQGLAVKQNWSINHRELKVGDLVTVTVDLTAKQDYSYLMINVPIPAGAVVMRKSAKGAFAEFEARYDQGIFFVTKLKAGTHKLSFQFKCQFAGRFQVPGARGELMYSPNIQGHSSSLKAKIAPKEG